MRPVYMLLFVLIVFESCLHPDKKEEKQSAESFQMSDTHFISNKIGWGIKLPGKDWEILPARKGKGINPKTKQDLRKAIGVDIDDKGLQELIAFRKDSANSFVAFIEPYKFSTDSEYEQTLRYQHDFFRDGYNSKNIPANFEMGATRIGGKMIDWFIVKSQLPGTNGTPLTFHLYNCLVNEYFFSLVAFSNNEKDLEKLGNIVYSSKFSEKD